jgi:hypothetical protein
MSDFDNFDEFDAVRDFRSTLATPEPGAHERIRARIVELAHQRGLGRQTPEVEEQPQELPPPKKKRFRRLRRLFARKQN